MKKFLLKYYAELTSLFIFVIYLQTLSPTVTEYDSGELATVQATLGIAHPTGYPLFTILGYLFSKIPLLTSIVYKLNLLCAIWCAAAVLFLIKTMKLLLDNIKFFKQRQLTNQQINYFSQDGVIKIITAISTGLVFAFSYTFWSQATKVEVYSLQLFLSSLIIYWVLRIYLFKENNSVSENDKIYKGWIFTSVLVGFAFANHMMTLFLLPFLIFLFFSQTKFTVHSIKQFTFLMLIAFSVSTLLYSYLIISAGVSSGLNIWLQPNLFDWIDHIRGKVYHSFFVSSFEEVPSQLRAFGESIMPQLFRESRRGGDFSINIILIFAGMLISAFTLRRLFFLISLIMLTTFIFSISYGILDIQEYFLLIFFSFSIFWGICIYFLLSTAKISKSLLVCLIVPLLLISVQVANNYKEIDRSDNYLFEDYVNALFDTMEPNSLLITNQWDTIESPAFYFQKVEGRRKDLEIVNLELLTFKSYKMDLKKKYAIVKNDSLNMINIDNLLNPIKTYIASEVIRDYIYEQKLILNGSVYLVPHLLAFKISTNNEYIPAKDPTFKIRIPRFISIVDEQIINLVCTMLVNRIKYELQYNKADRAKVYYQKLVTDFPMYLPPSELLFLAENI